MKQTHKTLLLWVILIVAFLGIWQFLNADGPQRQPMPFSDFVSLVRAPKEARHVDAVKIKDREYTFTIIGPNQNAPERLKYDVKVEYEEDETNPFLTTTLTILVPMVFLLVMFYLFMRQLQAGGGKAMSFGKSRARLLNEAQNKVTFADV